MECRKVFKYQPLDTTKRQIRLVRLSSTNPLREDPAFSIAHYDLETTPPFKALSYCWGQHMTAIPIEIDGGSMQIYRSLHQFLRSIQFQLDHSYYWIDQLCIDQTNNVEKNHQVGMMRNIYARAEETVISLHTGSYSNMSFNLLDFLQSLHLPREQDYGQHIYDKGRVKGRVTNWLSQHPDSFQSFLQNPYWERLWIVQEILLAKKVSLICTSGACVFSRLELITPYLKSQHRDLGQAILWFLDERNPLAGGFNLPVRAGLEYDLGYIVTTCKAKRCHDPKDRIFALQGLVAPAQQLVVNYDSPLEQVVKEAVAMIIRSKSEHFKLVDEKVDACLSLIDKLFPKLDVRHMLRHLALDKLGEGTEESKERLIQSIHRVFEPRKKSP